MINMMVKKALLGRDYIVGIVIALLSALIALLLISNNFYGAALIGVVVGVFGLLIGIKWLPQIIFLLLVTKPVIDLGWRWSLTYIFGQRMNAQAIIGVAVMFLTAIAIIIRGKRFVYWPWVIMLVAITFISIVFSFSSSGINDLIRLYAGISFFFTAGMVLYKQDAFDQFSHYFLIVMVIPLLLAFAQRAELLPYDYLDWLGGGIVVGRASGTYQHPLVLIYFLIYAIPLALYLLSQPNIKWFYWLALWGFIGISLIAVLFTYHRVGLMAICLQIWVWFVLNKRYRFALILAAMGSLVVFWRWDDLRILYRNIFDILSGEVTLFSSQFLRGRGSLWFLFLESFVDASPFNWLIGHGNAVAEGFVPGYGYVISVEPHNDFIRLLHTYGLIGLCLYFIILGSFLWNSLKLRRSPSFFSRQIGNIMITVLLGVVMLSITTEPMRYPSPIWYLFALGSIVVVLSRKEHVLI